MKTELIQVRVDEELKKKLQKMASDNSRTLGDFIRVQLTELVKTSKNKK